MNRDDHWRISLCGALLSLEMVSACGGKAAETVAATGGESSSTGGNSATGAQSGGAGGETPLAYNPDALKGSWLLSTLIENGQKIPLESKYSYKWKPDHPDVELDYLVLEASSAPGSLSVSGQFYRWEVGASMQADGTGECIFSGFGSTEYPPLDLIGPVSSDFCPDACTQALDSFRSVLLSAAHCELSKGKLTLLSEDHESIATFTLSEDDMSGILN